ncbi:unnamed protein product, partial [Meganyctiphanes norvegica]
MSKSPHGIFKAEVKDEFEVDKYHIKLQPDKIKLKEEIEIYEEPITFRGESHIVKKNLTHPREIYRCSFCEKTYSKNKQLVIHLSTHCSVVIQKLSPRLLSLSVPITPINNVYTCSLCDKACLFKRDLIKHQRSHTGMKVYQYNKHNLPFSRNTNISYQRTHTVEKPYHCSNSN